MEKSLRDLYKATKHVMSNYHAVIYDVLEDKAVGAILEKYPNMLEYRYGGYYPSGLAFKLFKSRIIKEWDLQDAKFFVTGRFRYAYDGVCMQSEVIRILKKNGFDASRTLSKKHTHVMIGYDGSETGLDISELNNDKKNNQLLKLLSKIDEYERQQKRKKI